MTKERNKKNVGRVKEKTPSNITVEIIDGEAGRQTDNLIGNSALRSDKQAANEGAHLDQSQVMNAKAIAISVDGDTKAVAKSDNKRTISSAEVKKLENRRKVLLAANNAFEQSCRVLYFVKSVCSFFSKIYIGLYFVRISCYHILYLKSESFH